MVTFVLLSFGETLSADLFDLEIKGFGIRWEYKCVLSKKIVLLIIQLKRNCSLSAPQI